MTIEETKYQLTEVRSNIQFLQNRRELIICGLPADYTLDQCEFAIKILKGMANELAEQLEFMEFMESVS